MKRYLALLLSGLLLFCAACGDASAQPSEADPIRVGVLTDGDAIDRGINQQIWNALESLTEEGLPLQRAYRIPGTDTLPRLSGQEKYKIIEALKKRLKQEEWTFSQKTGVPF